MAERSFDPNSLSDMRAKLRVLMMQVSRSPRFANSHAGAVVAAYDWLGTALGIDGEVEVDDLDLPTLRRAFALLRPERVKGERSSIDANEFDAWLLESGRTRADFSAVTGRDPRGIEKWSGQIPKWAEVVMDVLDAMPALWGVRCGAEYEGTLEDFRHRLAKAGSGVTSFALLTGSRDDTVRRWTRSKPPPGWVELVLQGLEAGVISP